MKIDFKINNCSLMNQKKAKKIHSKDGIKINGTIWHYYKPDLVGQS